MLSSFVGRYSGWTFEPTENLAVFFFEVVDFVAVKRVHPVESHALAWLHFFGGKQHGIFGEEKCVPWEKQGAKVWGPC